jgi:hypothetical protein
MPDEDLCKVLWALVSGFEAVDVVVGDKPAVEVKEFIKFLAHFVYVSGFDDFFEVFDYSYHVCFLLFCFDFFKFKGCESLQSVSELKGLG